MSTLKVRGIRHDADTTDAISIASTGDVTFNNDVDVTGDLTVTGTLTGDGSNLTGISSYANADALTLFNASGSAPVYACRAWVNFNGSGTVTIRDSGNVTSITDNSSGNYTVNFTTAMPDANYAVKCSGGTSGSLSYPPVVGYDSATQATGSVGLSSRQNSSPNQQDINSVSVAIFR